MYTLNCCFFGLPSFRIPVVQRLPPVGRQAMLPQPEPPPSRSGLGEWALTMVHPAVWAGLAAGAGLGVYLTYRWRKFSLSRRII